MSRPIPFVWRDGKMEPLARFRSVADKTYEVGRTYVLEPIELRSALAHKHFFACVNDCWENLPSDLAEQFKSPTHLRKWALCRAGYADERTYAAPSHEEAIKMAAFIDPLDEYAVITVSDCLVRVFTAKSQAIHGRNAMSREEFADSKRKVLDILADLIGTDRKTLEAQHPETDRDRHQ